MAYRKRDYLYPKSGTSKTVVLIKNHAPILISDDSGPPALVQDRMTSEMMDGFCETFYAMLELAESQGLPLLQLCRVPNFIDFVEKNI